MTLHTLKTDPTPFETVWNLKKTHEIRINDRHFEPGDTLQLCETVCSSVESKIDPCRYPLAFTGRQITTDVLHVQHGYGLMPGHVVLSLDVFNMSRQEKS